MQSCRLNDINQAKSETGDLEWRPDEALVMNAYTICSEMLSWCLCLVCVVEQRFVFMDSLNCSVFTIVIGEALETVVIFRNCLMLYNFLQVL